MHNRSTFMGVISPIPIQITYRVNCLVSICLSNMLANFRYHFLPMLPAEIDGKKRIPMIAVVTVGLRRSKDGKHVLPFVKKA